MAHSHKAVVDVEESRQGHQLKCGGVTMHKEHVHKAWTHTLMIVLDKNVKWQCGVHGL